MKPLFISLLTAFSLSATAQNDISSQTIDEFGNYFIQDFEDASTYPLNQSTEEQRFVIEGQGEWLYKGTYQSTNTNYNVDGSTANLRLPKNGSYYVITPVLNNGVGSVSFYLGRATVTLWTSTDGGNTWQNIGTASSKGVVNTIQIESLEVNRIKISNEASKDADIDNLAVTAQAFGTIATVQTDSAYNITQNSATLSGTILDAGSQTITECGILWSTTNAQPSLSDRIAKSEVTNQAHFEVQLTRLRASQTIYYRAYARSSAGYAYGDAQSFTTLEKTGDEEGSGDSDIVGNAIWCAPDADDTTADGSSEHPFFDLQRAIDIAEPGDRIWMKAGTYVYDKRINIDDRNGTEDAPIEVFAYGGRAILDFSAQPYHKHSDNPYQGVRLTSSYWHFYRIDITHASDNGMLIERNKPTGGSSSDIFTRTQDGHDNIIEQCNFYGNGDTGLQIKNLGSYNYIINCDAYENADEDDGDADGFAPKISVGDGNYFFGCRAWNNSDDGYDVVFLATAGLNKSLPDASFIGCSILAGKPAGFYCTESSAAHLVKAGALDTIFPASAEFIKYYDPSVKWTGWYPQSKRVYHLCGNGDVRQVSIQMGNDGPVCALGGKLLFNAAQRNPQAVEAALASHPSEKAANYFSIWFRDLSENEKATVRKQAGRIKSPAVRDFFQNLTK